MSVNSHYVPLFVLRHYGEHLCIYDIKTGQYEKGRNPAKVFSQYGLYPEDIENSFADKIERPFAQLFASKLLAKQKDIVLSRDELMLVKKFFLLSTVRTIDSFDELAGERYFYDSLHRLMMNEGLTEEEYEREGFKPPFIEKETKDLSNKEYCFRTLRCILDAKDINPETIANMPNATYAAYRWSWAMYLGYLAFWDSSTYNDEFIISDIGMTSENEVGWNGVTVFNHKKIDFIRKMQKNDNGLSEKYTATLVNQLINQTYFHENFMMFPLSAERMIVFVNPFFKFRTDLRDHGTKVPSLNEFTKIPDEDLFEPNEVEYKMVQSGFVHSFSDDDKYIYHPHKLSGFETRYCNALFMDRIYHYLGFSSLEKVKRSTKLYHDLNEGYVPRVDYTSLYNLLDIK